MDLDSIALRCEHFSGADLRHLVETASTDAFEELRAWRISLAKQTHSSPSKVSDEKNISTNPSKKNCSIVELQNNLSLQPKDTSEKCGVFADSSTSQLENSNSSHDNTESQTMDAVSNDGSWEDMDEDHESPAAMECQNLQSESTDENKNEKTVLKTDENAGVSELPPLMLSDEDLLAREDNPFKEGLFVVYGRHFESALTKVQPSVSQKVSAIMMFGYDNNNYIYLVSCIHKNSLTMDLNLFVFVFSLQTILDLYSSFFCLF